MKECTYFKNNAAAGLETITVAKNLVQKANNEKDIKILKSVIAHELGHSSEHHTIITISYWFIAKVAGAVIYNMITPYTKVDFFSKGKTGIMMGALVHKAIDLSLFKGTNFVTNVVSSYIGRQLEYKADNAAVKSGLGKDLIKFFLYLKQENPEHTKPSYLSSFIKEHPSIENRIANIIEQEKKTSKSLTPLGFVLKSTLDFIQEQFLEDENLSREFKIFNDKSIIDYAKHYVAE